MRQRVNEDTPRHAGNDVGGVVECMSGSPVTHAAQGQRPPMHSFNSDSRSPLAKNLPISWYTSLLPAELP